MSLSATALERFAIDTHPLIWHLAGQSDRLGPAARTALQRVEKGRAVGLIPAIVLAEFAYLSEKGRVGLSLLDVLEEIDRGENFQILPLTREQLGELPYLTSSRKYMTASSLRQLESAKPALSRKINPYTPASWYLWFGIKSPMGAIPRGRWGPSPPPL